jgi:hypothetical protein
LALSGNLDTNSSDWIESEGYLERTFNKSSFEKGLFSKDK